MHILLQDQETSEFLNASGERTALRDCAYHFLSALEAELFCSIHRLCRMQMLLEFDDARLNFTVPITDELGKRLSVLLRDPTAAPAMERQKPMQANRNIRAGRNRFAARA